MEQMAVIERRAGADGSVSAVRLVIVQWFSPGDEMTGWMLKQQLLSRGLAPASVEHVDCHSRQEVVDAISVVTRETAKKGISVLHIESHSGVDDIHSLNPQALGLMGRDPRINGTAMILWKDLMPLLELLSIQSQYSNFVMLGAYSSEHLTSHWPSKAAPASNGCMQIGKFDTKIETSALLQASAEFYANLLIHGSDLGTCQEIANAHLRGQSTLRIQCFDV